MSVSAGSKHSIESSTLADLLERVLDKGLVISGDIRVKLVDVELLTVQIRLVICSVDKAVEMGMDWWKQDSSFFGIAEQQSLERLDKRLDQIEAQLLDSGIEAQVKE